MFYVFGFYKFKKFKDLKKNKLLLQKKIVINNIRGTIILSKEGINGTISGKIINLNKIKSFLKKHLILIVLILKIFQRVYLTHFIEEKLKLKKKLFRSECKYLL